MPLNSKLFKANIQIYNQQDCAALHDEGRINHRNICGGRSGSPIGQCNDEYYYFQYHLLCHKKIN